MTIKPRRSGGLRIIRLSIAAAAAISVTACGGGGSSAAPASSMQTASVNQAAASTISISEDWPGVTPFIEILQLRGAGVSNLAAIEFTIAPKPGSVSKPVDVWTSIAALRNRGYVSDQNGIVMLPVFGLYAAYDNQVAIQLQFRDGTAQTLNLAIRTGTYTDPNGTYDQPTILQARAPSSALGFDFFYMKSGVGTPVVVDTDGSIRWVASGIANSISSTYSNGEFVIGSETSPTIYRLRLDGTISETTAHAPSITDFTHDISHGKVGLLGEVDTLSNDTVNLGATVAEMSEDGSVNNAWDLAALISAYMAANGDDPTAFVRPGTDWFHINAAIYDSSDDSVIVSSRENFVIKLDYRTGNILWILGDPTKYWYTFPSLRAKALTLEPGGLYPIGQHGISMTSDGLLMLFNDGAPSGHQPAGAPVGDSRNFSAVSAYAIDPTSMTAQEVWQFDDAQTIYSPFCGSAYEARTKSVLVDFAMSDSMTHSRLIGLDANHGVVFDFQYPNQPGTCNTSWNAVPIPFDNLVIN